MSKQKTKEMAGRLLGIVGAAAMAIGDLGGGKGVDEIGNRVVVEMNENGRCAITQVVGEMDFQTICVPKGSYFCGSEARACRITVE